LTGPSPIKPANDEVGICGEIGDATVAAGVIGGLGRGMLLATPPGACGSGLPLDLVGLACGVPVVGVEGRDVFIGADGGAFDAGRLGYDCEGA